MDQVQNRLELLQQLALQQEYLDDATISEVCAYSVQCLCVCACLLLLKCQVVYFGMVLSDSAKILEAFGIFCVKGRLFDHLEQIAYTTGIYVD